MMTVGKFIALRKTLGFSQTVWGEKLGLKLRTIQEIENGARPLRLPYALAAERVAMDVAVERREPMLAPTEVRRQAIALSNDLIGAA